MKKLASLAIVFFVVGVMPFISGDASAQKQVVVAGASMGTGPYMFSVAFSTLANKYYPQAKFVAQATGGSIENLKLINQKDIDIGLITPGALTAAKEGTRWFKDLKDSKALRYDNVRGISVYFSMSMHFIVRDNSPIRTIYDAKGKRVALGSPGSTIAMMSLDILEAYGLKKNVDYKSVELDAPTAATSWQDGMVDLWCQLNEVPSGQISDATALNNFRLLSIDDENIVKKLKDNKAISKEEGTALTTIEVGAYPTMKNNKPVVTISSYSGINAHKDLSDDIVYGFTKAIYDHLDELQQRLGPSAKRFKLEDAIAGLVLPLHPGAAKYYREKGVLK